MGERDGYVTAPQDGRSARPRSATERKTPPRTRPERHGNVTTPYAPGNVTKKADMALTAAEKQRAYRDRRRAELQALRERVAKLEADLARSGLEIRSIEISRIRVRPDMLMPEAERFQELEQAMRAGQSFMVVVAESEDGNDVTLVHGPGILETARRIGLDAVRALVIPPGSLVDAPTERVNRMAAEQQQRSDQEVAQQGG